MDKWDEEAANLIASAHSPADRVVQVAARLRELGEENERLRIKVQEMPVDEVEEHFDDLRQQLAASEKRLDEARRIIIHHQSCRRCAEMGCSDCGGCDATQWLAKPEAGKDTK